MPENSLAALSRLMLRPMVVLAGVAALAVNAPGHLSYDSIVQLYEGRSGQFHSMHPPVMSMLLGVFDSLVPGTALFQALTLLGFFAAIFGTLPKSISRVSQLPAALLCLMCLATPVILIYQGIVWKDVLFANLSVLTFALAAAGMRQRGGAAAWLWVLAALVAGLAATIRQQGVIVPLALALLAAGTAGDGVLRRRAGAGFGVLLIAGASFLCFTLLVSWWAVSPTGDTTAQGKRSLQTFDIIGMTANGAPLARFTDPASAQAITAYADSYYTGARIDQPGAPPLPDALSTREFDTDRVWKGMVAAEPLAYVRHRLAFTRWFFFPPAIESCLPVHIGISEGPAFAMEALNLTAHVRPSDARLYEYSTLWRDTPIYVNGFWLIASVLIGGALVWRRLAVPGDAAILAALTTAVVYDGSFIAIGIACDFRYGYLAVTSVVLGLAQLARAMASADEAPTHPHGTPT